MLTTRGDAIAREDLVIYNSTLRTLQQVDIVTPSKARDEACKIGS